MTIYDCFTFNNEFDMLKLRFEILNSFVDYFVLVEATKTHAGKLKPLFFDKNKTRFKKWEKKIIHIIVDDMPNPGKFYFKNNWKLNSIFGLGRWKPEIYQRNQIKKGLKNCKNDDIILISDLDEIPNPKKFDKLKELIKKEVVVLFNQNLYYYYLNGFVGDGWYGTRVCSFKNLKKHFGFKPDRVRRVRSFIFRLKKLLGKEEAILSPGGWHFSYIGGIKNIISKISSTSHSELDEKRHKDPLGIKRKINSGEDIFGRNLKIKYIPLDSTFPDEILKNKKRYSKFVMKS